ncbi:MAG: metal ABC transporter permease [Thermoleophilia bacterium]|nr:metal ABC transporter permease [Thermoleophilia bacterium]
MPSIFQYEFMIRAFVVGLIVGVIAPVIGMFLIVKRYSLFADTLAHVSLLGIAIGLATGTQPIIAAAAFAVLGAVGIDRLQKRTKLFGESVLALFLSGSLALATVIIGLSQGFNVSLLNFLFGSITTVRTVDLYFISILGAVVLGVLLLLYKELFFISFDEEAAKVSGLPVGRIGLILVVLAAVTVSLSIRTVGVLLIGALMVIPGITAMQLKKSFRTTMIYAVFFSLLSVILGLFISFYLGLASGGSIVLIAMALFLLSLLTKAGSGGA